MSEKTEVFCPQCGKSFRVGPDKLGKSAKCPCGTKFRLEAPVEPEPEDDDLYGFAEDDLDIPALGGGGGGDNILAPTAAPAANPALGAGAAGPLGGSVYAASAREMSRPKRVADGADGTWGKGLAFALAGMAGAIMLWLVIRATTGIQLGFMATVLGAGIGGGFALGLKTPSALAATVAGVMAVAGFAVAKALIFFLIALPGVPDYIAALEAEWEEEYQREQARYMGMDEGELYVDPYEEMSPRRQQLWYPVEVEVYAENGIREDRIWGAYEGERLAEVRQEIADRINAMSDEEVEETIIGREIADLRQARIDEEYNRLRAEGSQGRSGKEMREQAEKKFDDQGQAFLDELEAERMQGHRESYASRIASPLAMTAGAASEKSYDELERMSESEVEAYYEEQNALYEARYEVEFAKAMQEAEGMTELEMLERVEERAEEAQVQAEAEYEEVAGWKNFDDGAFTVEPDHVIAAALTFHCADPIFLVVSIVTACGLAATGTLNR